MKHEGTETDDDVSISSYGSSSLSDSLDDIEYLDEDDVDVSIEILVEIARKAYVKRDEQNILLHAIMGTSIEGLTRLRILKQIHEYQLAFSKFVDFYINFEQLFIKKALLKSDVALEAKKIIDDYAFNDVVGFSSHFERYLSGMVYSESGLMMLR